MKLGTHGVLLPLLAGAALAAAAALWQPGYRVVDGDTIDHGFWRWRLVGFDAPETRRAKCAAERVLGERAEARLRALLAAGKPDLVAVRGKDQFGRRLARLSVGGRDAGEILIAEGLARPYAGGPRAGWCE